MGDQHPLDKPIEERAVICLVEIVIVRKEPPPVR